MPMRPGALNKKRKYNAAFDVPDEEWQYWWGRWWKKFLDQWLTWWHDEWWVWQDKPKQTSNKNQTLLRVLTILMNIEKLKKCLCDH
jgi:hypothetical protein